MLNHVSCPLTHFRCPVVVGLFKCISYAHIVWNYWKIVILSFMTVSICITVQDYMDDDDIICAQTLFEIRSSILSYSKPVLCKCCSEHLVPWHCVLGWEITHLTRTSPIFRPETQLKWVTFSDSQTDGFKIGLFCFLQQGQKKKRHGASHFKYLKRKVSSSHWLVDEELKWL